MNAPESQLLRQRDGQSSKAALEGNLYFGIWQRLASPFSDWFVRLIGRLGSARAGLASFQFIFYILEPEYGNLCIAPSPYAPYNFDR